MPNPVLHFEIISKNADTLASFFREAFDWDIGAAQPGAGLTKYLILRPTGEEMPAHGINGGIGETPEGYAGHVTFYIGVSDIAAALQKVESLGGKRMMGPDQVPGGPIIALFTDPEGHVIGLVQPEV